MKKNVVKFSVLSAACVLVPVFASGADLVNGSARDTISREAVSRQQVKTAADGLVIRANELFSAGDYPAAIKMYIRAKQALQEFKGGDFADDIKVCSERISKCYFYMAQDAVVKAEERALANDYDEAIKLCRQAVEYYPENKAALERKIAAFEKEQKAAIVREATGEAALVPNKESQEYRIEVLLAQGRKLMQAKQYDKAVRKFRSVLLIDPYNSDALHNIRASNIRSGKFANKRYNLEHRKLITELEWKWATPILPEGEQEAVNMLDTMQPKEQSKSSGLEQKLRSLHIPAVSYDSISIPSVVKHLQELSKNNDPEQKGINIYYRRPRPEDGAAEGENGEAAAEPAAPAPAPAPAPEAEGESEEYSEEGDGEEGEEGEAKAADVEADSGKLLTLNLPAGTLYDALRRVCDSGDLQMRVERYAVIIAPKTLALEELETRIFPADNAIFEDVDAGEDGSAAMAYLKEHGVTFPKGATAVFDPRISRLIVTNTQENLDLVGELLQQNMSDKPALVEITAKFIEVHQNDLKELGFDYTVSYNQDNYSNVPSTDEHGNQESSRRLSFGDSLTGMTRNGTADGSVALFTLKGWSGTEARYDDNGNLIGYVANGLAYEVELFAQNRLNSSDTLASPRIVTLENTTAHIQMVKEQAFVDDYDEGELEVEEAGDDNSSGNRRYYRETGPFPNFDEVTPLGIRMDVKPEVDRERRTIRVRMRPTVTSHAGYTEYENVSLASGTITYMRKPIIDTREIDTTITIYDGETIVLGGVVDDINKAVSDKIPILGDLPIVGRFFQSRGNSGEKKTLLIFMTCRLVKPDGTPLYPDAVVGRGVPQPSRLD